MSVLEGRYHDVLVDRYLNRGEFMRPKQDYLVKNYISRSTERLSPQEQVRDLAGIVYENSQKNQLLDVINIIKNKEKHRKQFTVFNRERKSQPPAPSTSFKEIETQTAESEYELKFKTL